MNKIGLVVLLIICLASLNGCVFFFPFDEFFSVSLKPLSSDYVYAATNEGLSISTNGGTSFTTRTAADGLGDNWVHAVFVSGSTVYAAVNGGLSISTAGGISFTNRTVIDGLGNDVVLDVYVSGSTVYAATDMGGLSISTNGGTSFIKKTNDDGLGSGEFGATPPSVYGVYAAAQ